MVWGIFCSFGGYWMKFCLMLGDLFNFSISRAALAVKSRCSIAAKKNCALRRRMQSLQQWYNYPKISCCYLKGLWRGGHWELNSPHFWIPHVLLHLVTNFQLCISTGCRENRPLVFIGKIGIPNCMWCHTPQIRGNCNGYLYERVSAA